MAKLSQSEVQSRIRDVKRVLDKYNSKGYELAGYRIDPINYHENGRIKVSNSSINVSYDVWISLDSTLKGMGIKKASFITALKLKKYLKEKIVEDLKNEFRFKKVSIHVSGKKVFNGK